MAFKRQMIAPKRMKRYVRRDVRGRINESEDLACALSSDRRIKAKAAAKPGQGDRGDRR